MFFACILLTIAIAGGTLLTFLYQEHSTITLRLCIGACTGLALMATLGFVSSTFLGLNAASIARSAGLLLLPVLLLLKAQYRIQLAQETRAALQQWRDSTFLWVTVLYVGVALVIGLALAQNMQEQPDGIYTGVQNNLGDLPFHLQVISNFVYGQNMPVEDPTYAGVRFTYPILADFLTAMLVRAGASLAAAMWLQNMALALAFIGLLHHWTRAFTGSRLAAVFAPLLVVFSGGLGWWFLMQDLRVSNGGLLHLLAHLPHDYTIVNDTIFRWGNSLTTLLLPQRSFLFGLPLAVSILYLWWTAIQASANTKSSSTQPRAVQESQPDDPKRRMLAAGICAGLLPLIHTHGFLVVLGAGACLALLFRSLGRVWLVFFVAALLIALPGVWWLSHGSAIQAGKFIGWQIGWDRDGYNVLWFWFVNTGFFIPLLLGAILLQKYSVPPRLVMFYAPFSLGFIIPNLLRLSPWIWDNIKFLFYWYVASVPLVAFVLARLWQHGSRRRWLAGGLLATLTFSGALDILRVITHATEFQEFTREGIQMASFINLEAPARARVLHAPVWNSPVFLTGRRSLLGYDGWIWSRGLETSQREADIHKMYSGGPDALALFQKYRVDYALVGPSEFALPTNQTFWTGCTRLAQIGAYQLYKTDCKE